MGRLQDPGSELRRRTSRPPYALAASEGEGPLRGSAGHVQGTMGQHRTKNLGDAIIQGIGPDEVGREGAGPEGPDPRGDIQKVLRQKQLRVGPGGKPIAPKDRRSPKATPDPTAGKPSPRTRANSTHFPRRERRICFFHMIFPSTYLFFPYYFSMCSLPTYYFSNIIS